jgi:hypothetical protein
MPDNSALIAEARDHHRETVITEWDDGVRLEFQFNGCSGCEQPWPCDAIRLADALTAAQADTARLIAAAEESLKHGQHDGACDNDEYGDDACSLHVAASGSRHAALRAAVDAARAQEGKP